MDPEIHGAILAATAEAYRPALCSVQRVDLGASASLVRFITGRQRRGVKPTSGIAPLKETAYAYATEICVDVRGEFSISF